MISVLVVGSEVTAAIGAAISFLVIPSYISSYFNSLSISKWLPLLFGVGGIMVAIKEGGLQAPHWLSRTVGNVRRRRDRNPIPAPMAPSP